MTIPVLRPLASWVAALESRRIPGPVLQAARLQVLNMAAAVHAAAADSETVASIEPALADLFPGGGRATSLASGRRFGPVPAALANCAHSMAQDFDDIVWMGHTGHSAVFASLAVAEHEGRGVEDLLTAVVAANEVAGRLGASTFLGPLNGQMWSFIHLIGAAAAAAKLLALDAEQTENALSIALAQPTFPLAPGFFWPTSKLLTAATPTAAGIQAAYFARRKMTGAPSIVEDPRGFWSRFTYLPLPSMMGALGEFWVTGTLCIKTFPGCHYFQTACSAIERLLARHPSLALEDVDGIVLQTSKFGAEVTRFAAGSAPPGAVAPVNVNFDLALCAATLFHARRLGPQEVGARWLAANAGALRRWRERIAVEHDPAMTLKVLSSASAVAAGREALGALRLRDLLRVSRRYRAEYRFSLLGAGELTRLLSAARSRAHRGPFSGVAQHPAEGAVPLYFPGRVRIRLRGGLTDSEELDLPEGSVAAPAPRAQLEKKFFAACAPRLGPEEARAALEAGLAPGGRSLEELAALLSPSGTPRSAKADPAKPPLGR
jgi:2-methylcitrate dehydratase PrpD